MSGFGTLRIAGHRLARSAGMASGSGRTALPPGHGDCRRCGSRGRCAAVFLPECRGVGAVPGGGFVVFGCVGEQVESAIAAVDVVAVAAHWPQRLGRGRWPAEVWLRVLADRVHLLAQLAPPGELAGSFNVAHVGHSVRRAPGNPCSVGGPEPGLVTGARSRGIRRFCRKFRCFTVIPRTPHPRAQAHKRTPVCDLRRYLCYPFGCACAARRCRAAAFSNSTCAPSCADPRCSISRDPQWEEYTICTAVAPDDVFTVRTYGDTRQPYGHPPSAHFQPHKPRNRRSATRKITQAEIVSQVGYGFVVVVVAGAVDGEAPGGGGAGVAQAHQGQGGAAEDVAASWSTGPTVTRLPRHLPPGQTQARADRLDHLNATVGRSGSGLA